jgi:hypothetical protein
VQCLPTFGYFTIALYRHVEEWLLRWIGLSFHSNGYNASNRINDTNNYDYLNHGSVSTVDADMSHAINRCADIPDQLRQPDGISVPTRLQQSCPSHETARPTSPADYDAPRWYGPGCCARRRGIARAVGARGPCRPYLDPSPGGAQRRTRQPYLNPWLRLTAAEARQALPSCSAMLKGCLRGREWPVSRRLHRTINMKRWS